MISMMKTIFINYSEGSSIPKRSKKSDRKVRDSGRERQNYDNGRESAI